MKDYKIKDQILQIVISNKRGVMSLEISKQLGLSHDKVYCLAEDMITKGVINGIKIAGDKEVFAAFSLTPIPYTSVFYENGGFKKQHKSEIIHKWTKEWRAAVIAGVITLIVNTLSEIAKTPLQPQEYEQIESRIESLKQRIDKIAPLTLDTLKKSGTSK